MHNTLIQVTLKVKSLKISNLFDFLWVIVRDNTKVDPITGHEWEQRYSSTLSLTSALVVGGWTTPRPRTLYHRERDPIPIVLKVGWTPGSVWKGAENFASYGIRSLDLPAPSESLYRLSYHDAPCCCICSNNKRNMDLVNFLSRLICEASFKLQVDCINTGIPR